jgi:hypothetical protein
MVTILGNRGISFAGHVPLPVTVAEASDTAQKSIEHLTQVAAGCAAHDEKYPANRAALAKRFAEGLAGSPGSQSRVTSSVK